MALISNINGWTSVPSPDTYKVTIADLDASGDRSGNGTLYRDRVAVKRTIEVGWYTLSESNLSVLLTKVSDVFFTVTYKDPQLNAMRTAKFYVSDRNQGVAIKQSDGTYAWRDISFSFVER